MKQVLCIDCGACQLCSLSTARVKIEILPLVGFPSRQRIPPYNFSPFKSIGSSSPQDGRPHLLPSVWKKLFGLIRPFKFPSRSRRPPPTSKKFRRDCPSQLAHRRAGITLSFYTGVYLEALRVTVRAVSVRAAVYSRVYGGARVVSKATPTPNPR